MSAACTNNTVDFSYSPASPHAGEIISFTATTDTGDDFAWTFGDAGSSTSSSPTKIYKKAGEYVVTLKVDNKKRWTCSKIITVQDTFPTIGWLLGDTISTFYPKVFQTMTLASQIYNPFSHVYSYEWQIDNADYVVLSDSVNGPQLKIYFTDVAEDVRINLAITSSQETYTLQNRLDVIDTLATSLLMQTNEQMLKQRMFTLEREEKLTPIVAGQQELLAAKQDTVQEYNGQIFKAPSLPMLPDYEVESFVMYQGKIYFRSNGLYIANMDGSNVVNIEPEACSAFCLDNAWHRVYWATQEGVYCLPQIGSDNNKFTTIPRILSTQQGVIKMTYDQTPRYID